MKIEEVRVESFRGIVNQTFRLGDLITIIAGQNGTMKSTLLGIISQTFSMRGVEPFYKEKTIDGYSFESKFNEKFKWSKDFDVPGSHKWTVKYCDNQEQKVFNAVSSIRKSNSKADSIRIISAAGKVKGTDYIKYPVIFLSLKRVTPFGEEHNEKVFSPLIDSEKRFFAENHNDILSIMDSINEIKNFKSKNKNSLLTNTDYYDYLTNSAGQDNVGKIISAIISFKRLKEKYPNDYKGGLLFIDEADATLFPRAQEKLMTFLRHNAAKLNLQVIVTTHSFSIIKTAYEREFKDNTNVLFLKKCDKNIVCDERPDLDSIMAELNIRVVDKNSINKIRLYCEDKEASLFIKSILDAKRKKSIKIMDGVCLGCDNYFSLLKSKVPEFLQSIVVLDGDARKKIKKHGFKNVICLPSTTSPEALLYDFLKGLNDNDEIWEQSLGGYNKQKCFASYINRPSDRDTFKLWFKEQILMRKTNRNALFKRWQKENEQEVRAFLNDFDNALQVLQQN